jgi:hypothetical protein
VPGVVPRVEKHIGKRHPDLARRLEWPRVIAVAEDAAGPFGEAIEPPRDPNLQRPETTRERPPVPSLDDEVQVRALEREVDHPKIRAALMQAADGILERAELQLGAERAHRVSDPKGGVYRMAKDMNGSRAMRNTGRPLRRSPRALARTAPAWVLRVRTARSERKLDRRRRHLNQAKLYHPGDQGKSPCPTE